jgi:hypothetical protein
LFSRPRRRAERQAEGSTKRHRPLSYANVAATIALVLALGGGTAWAVKHIIHYKITKLGQIAPGVVSQLKTPGLSDRTLRHERHERHERRDRSAGTRGDVVRNDNQCRYGDVGDRQHPN